MKPKTLKPKPFTQFTSLRSRLTTAQRAVYRVVFDGLDPCQLEGDERAKAYEAFGQVETIPPEARRVFVQVKGRGIGGTRLAAERCLQLGMTLGLEGVEQGELVYVFFGGPKIRHGRIGLRFAFAEAERLGLEIVDSTRDYFTVRRHDGHLIRFEAFAASRGGDNIRGVHIAAACLTEAGFYYDSEGGANGEAIFSAIIPRLLHGGQVVIESTPWVEGSGLLWKEFTANWGAPSRAVAALCPTPLMRDDPETLAMVAAEVERDSDNAERELFAKFLPAGSERYFDHFAISRCPSENLPLVISPPHTGWTVIGGYDPAYVRDAAEGVIVRTNGTRYEVVELFTRVPAKGKPLVPSEVDKEFAARVKHHGGRTIATDQHYRESVRENVAALDIWLCNVPGSNAGKCEVFGTSRELIHGDFVRWSAGHKRLTRQCGEVISKPLPGGLVAISSPRRRGDHGDAAHALALALWGAANGKSEPAERTLYVPRFGVDRLTDRGGYR